MACHSSMAGRDGQTGLMRIEAIIATLSAINGSEQDLGKVLLIEKIYQEFVKENADRA